MNARECPEGVNRMNLPQTNENVKCVFYIGDYCYLMGFPLTPKGDRCMLCRHRTNKPEKEDDNVSES
jgi:hypothetical protein